MREYDIGIGWASPYDRTFARILKDASRRKRKSFREITFETLSEDCRKIANGHLYFKRYLDRGSIDDVGFALLSKKLAENGMQVINNPDAVIRFSSKTILYPILRRAKLPLPKTFIVNQKTTRRTLDVIAERLGAPFVIVSSYGAGDPSDRIFLTGENGENIFNFIKNNYADTFIAHEYIYPALVKGRTAWFRPIYVCGVVLPLWWDPLNHFYEPFGKSKEERVIAKKIEEYMRVIADITGFELFSSEFAMTESGKLFLVDYANNPIDLDSSENIPGGLPEATLEKIADLLVQ